MDDFIKPPRDVFKKAANNPNDKLNQELPTPDAQPPVVPTEPNLTTLETNTPNAGKDHLIAAKASRFTKKKVIIFSSIALILIGFFVYWFAIRSDDSPLKVNSPISVKKTTPKPKPISPLTGAEISDANLAKRPVTSLMIENSPDARPQSGLLEAGIVYEAVAEGGITRFLALYQEAQPQYIGPVRSARPYYVNFALAFDAVYGHVGGSPDAMNDIKSLGVKDLDQFYNAGAYWRTSDRYAPHNVYTSFGRLDATNKAKGYNSSKFTSYERKKDVPQTPTAANIDLHISGPLYNVRYVYDPTTNSYSRLQGSEAHIDEKSKAQIKPKVVIALVMNKGVESDGLHTTYRDVGSGKMYVFQDGIASEGTWSKADRRSQFVFKDKNGLTMKLNAGQTWISLVAQSGDVTFKP